ncbi:PepSY domain-containing protein [Listeria fleischmannii]|jgi:uncharacterized membrane protein YkoI|uniref:Putative lipoprotein n=1 Tax=Listeria fleischmannii FSL S10-1203 TaxID=1265822 RepID=W7DR52_9LIST|nr:PepSY domain-containing protein [Listeria fleischmannii]EUJ52548.1 putative lipoprotein [Listeria fleischmannii FSL S10-1203]
MNTYKIVGVVATLALSAGLLAACGDNDDKQSNNNNNTNYSSKKSSDKTTSQRDLNGKSFHLSMDDAIKMFQDKNKEADLTSVKLEYENGKAVYKIEGADNMKDYEMVFDADSKEVLEDKAESMDADDKNDVQNDKINMTGIISMDEAMQKATAESDGAVTSIELERSFNDTVYSVSIENGTNESDVTVNAKDGSVMNVEND